MRRRSHTNPIQRVYAVGDIHGRFDLFRKLMNIVQRDQVNRSPVPTQIILLGDIVDRGPDSARMVRGCMKLTALSKRFKVLKGNHEEMMVEALTGDISAFEAWLEFGGRDTLLAWGLDAGTVDGPVSMDSLRRAAATVGSDAIRWLAKLPLYHRHDDFLFVHAGIRPVVSIRKQDPGDFMWIKEDFLQSEIDHGFTVVHGHSIVEVGPVVRHNRIGIDTGAYRTGRLTALGVERGETWFLDTVSDGQTDSTPVDDQLMIGISEHGADDTKKLT